MAKQLQLRKGTATEHNTFTGANGEVTVDTTNKTLRVHDGSTVGGTQLATLTSGLVPVSQLPDATTSVKGAVILNNTLTSTSTTQALTAAMGNYLNDKFNNQSFGVGQTWQDMTSSRVSGTTYTNSTSRTIELYIYTGVNGSSVTVDGSVLPTHGSTMVQLVVPSSKTYSFGGAFAAWWELR